ncbi:hypothetical protein ACP70R_009598 [Stipagrostis hirtigluma subsp. patula]
MEVFIHEDYVNKRNEVRREQRRMLQLEGNPGVFRPAAPACPESPSVLAQCLTPTGASPSSVRSPATATAEESGWSSEHRLFDCLKPY